MDDRARLLISGHCAGSLTPAEGAELVRLAKASAAVREELADQATMHRWLHVRAGRPLDVEAILKALPLDRTTIERVPARLPRGEHRRPARRAMAPWWGAVAALVLITSVAWLRSRGPADGLQVTGSIGLNTLTHAGVTSPVTYPARIPPGDTLDIGENGSVTVQAGDGTTLVLDADASFVVLDDHCASMDLELKHGRALASVVPRPEHGRLSLRTPHADVVVVGTRFTVTVEADHTSLDVAEGRVRFTPRGGTTRVVSATESATCPTIATASPGLSAPRIVDLHPVADADADEAHPSASFGGEKALRLIGTKPGSERVALLRFALPPGRIARAELLLHRLSGVGAVQVHAQGGSGSWREDDLRYYHLPPRGPVAGALHEEAGSWRCDVTEAVQAGSSEFMLVNTEATELTFASREEAGHAPMLRLIMEGASQP